MRRGLCLAVGAVASMTTGGTAEAQSALQGLVGSSDLQLIGGGIAIVAPRYEGSKHYHVVGAPFILPGGGGGDDSRFQIKGADDVRVRLFRYQGLDVGALAGWRFGREEDDGDRLRGLGDVDGGLVVGAYAAYHLGPVTPFVSYHHQVTGSDTGFVVRFGAETKAPINTWLTMTATAGATYASGDYMESFFGVNGAQSVASGLTRFDAGAGIKDFNLQLAADIKLDDRWGLKVSGRYARLLGDAADSPVIETENQFTGVVALTYKFSVPLP